MTMTATDPMSRPVLAPADKTERSAWKVYFDMLSTVVTVLVVMVAAVTIVIAIATRFSRYGQYTVFGHPVMTVLSGSMTPVIRTGDLVVDDPVNAVEAAHLRVGQIISVRDQPGSATIITHRIIAVRDGNGAVSYITKGDRNNSADLVSRPSSDVIGLFRYAVPRGGYFLNALHRPLVLGLLLASPVLWFIAGPLFQLAREMDDPGSREPANNAGELEADAP
jgi:signal peptidase